MFRTHRRTLLTLAAAAASAVVLSLISPPAYADAVDALRGFAQEVKSARATFTQTVTSPDGAKKKVSTGVFEFSRPNRFRFDYQKPYPQLIVGDGSKVWLHDPDLQQVTVRAMDKALGATPAALLAGQGMEKDFELKAQPDAEGLTWAIATPRDKDAAAFQSMRVAFRDKTLTRIEILDAFNQRTVLQFDAMTTNLSFGESHFRFEPPAGTSVLQP